MNEQLIIYKAKLSELSEIKSFINDNWKEGHIMSQCDELIDWQHKNNSENCYNFWIAKFDNTIVGLIGFIETNHFDNDLEAGDFWLAIWKVTDMAPKGTGLLLLNKVIRDDQFNSCGVVGISKVAKEIYSIMKFKTGVLSHYYVLNNSISDHFIAVIPDMTHNKSNADAEDAVLKEVYNYEFSDIIDNKFPKKSVKYFLNRYANHPIYKYKFLGAYRNSKLLCVFVVRKQFVKDDSCLRIVDLFGDIKSVGNLTREFQQLMDKENSEYIDLLNGGVDNGIFTAMGFSILDHDGEIIIPNYFEPYEQRNVRIEFAVKTSDDKDYIIYKGDADQDRPNQIFNI